MPRHKALLIGAAAMLIFTQSGCWSSKEIEDLAVYTGMALDKNDPSPVEKELEQNGGTYTKQDRITVTVQVVPVKPSGSSKEAKGKTSAYSNTSGTGDSVLEIFRQFSIRRDRPIIGHHLKVIVISSELLKQQEISQLMDFVLRDNDIRPNTKVFITNGKAKDTLLTENPNEIPSFHINDMVRNQFRTSKILSPVILSKLDALMYSKRSFILQNIVEADREIEFSGAGIIKGDSGHFVGELNQEDVECISWLTNQGESGAIKTLDEAGEPLTYEITSMKSHITAHITGEDQIAFDVQIASKGRLIEDWNNEKNPSSPSYQKQAAQLFEKRMEQMMQHLLKRMQSKYKVEVAGFGEALRIQHPKVWRRVKDQWDEKFSEATVSFKINMDIIDFGSSTE